MKSEDGVIHLLILKGLESFIWLYLQHVACYILLIKIDSFTEKESHLLDGDFHIKQLI